MTQKLGLDRLAPLTGDAALSAPAANAVRLLIPAVVGLSLVTLQVRIVEPLVLGSLLLASLAILWLTRAQLLALLLRPALGLLGATLATYLVIAVAVSALNSPPLDVNAMIQQGFFGLVAMAVAVGAAAVLRTQRLERLLVPCLGMLAAGCVVVLLTPLLTRVGLLPEYEISSRLSGTFSNPNDASLLASFTVAGSLAMLLSQPGRRLAYLGFGLGSVTAFATISHTAVAVVCIALLIGLRSIIANRKSVALAAGITGGLVLAGIYALWTVGAFDSVLFEPTRAQLEGETVFIAFDDLDALTAALQEEDCYEQPVVCRPVEMHLDGHGAAGAMGYVFNGDGGNTIYESQAMPVQWGQWSGQAVDFTLTTDDTGQSHATWDDPTKYEIRYGNDTTGWSEWTSLDNIGSSGPGTLKALRVSDGSAVEMRVSGTTWMARDDLVKGKDHRSTHLLMWPFWQYQVKEPGSQEWLPAKSLGTDGFFPLGEIEVVCAADVACGDDARLGYVNLEWIEPVSSSAGVLRNEGSNTLSDIVETRWELWEYGLERSIENPLVGQGLRELDADTTWSFVGVHNVYIMLVGEAGIVPLILWLWFGWVIVRKVLTIKPSLHRDLLGLLFLVIVAFALSFNHVWFLALYSVILGMTAAIADSPAPARAPAISDPKSPK